MTNRAQEMQQALHKKNGEPLHLRLNSHRSDYYQKLPDKPVKESDDLTIMVIEF